MPDAPDSRRKLVGVLGIVLTGALLAACSGSSSEANADPFPERPLNIQLTKIDPCSALSAVQRQQLGVERGEGDAREVGGLPTRTCTWTNYKDRFGYNLQTVPIDAEEALGFSGATVQLVNGFGAAQNTPEDYQGPGIPFLCQLTIDVNDNEGVRVQAQSSDTSSRDSSQSRAETCSRANAFARAVMTTLVNQQR